MAVDPNVDRSLDAFGFAQVLVVVKRGSGSTATQSRDAATSHFLDTIPQAAGGGAGAFSAALATAASTTTRTRKSPRVVVEREPPATLYYPRLGVAVGYVDCGGRASLASEQQVADVDNADALSLIRPVRVAAASPKTKLTWGLRRLKIDSLWKQGLTGKGVRVGHLDTGVDGKHPALKNRIAAFMEFDFSGGRVEGVSPHDSDEHGTHTAGTICGGQIGGTAIGVAPEAELCSGLVIEGGQATLRVLAGMEWSLEQQVRVLSMSLGFRGVTPFFLDVTQRLRELGVLPVFAIGNEGPGTSRSPGNYAEALAIGATDRNDQVALFSSSITFDRTVEPNQPDIVAPGVDVISARPGGGAQSMDGTSMATPHVAGVATLLFQAKPKATVEQMERAILESCTLLPDQSPLRSGHGLVNPRGALEWLEKNVP